MRLIFAEDYEDMSCEAAKIVSGQIYLKPQSVLGLATGSTPVGLYDRLVQIYQTVGLDFSGVTTFNLDEYVGMSSENPESYHYFMKKHLFSRVNLRPDHCFVPNGMAEDLEEEGRRYDAMIEAAGGIDLQVLGIGRNAHIGFNEPDIKFEAMTHEVRLDDETIRANARFFAREEDVPRYAISMGIRNIMLARRVLLLASGPEKAEAVYAAACGSVSPKAPASILQLHRDATIIVDVAAAARLPEAWKEKRFYNF